MAAHRHTVVLVTGASSGIGRATAAILAEAGFKVYGSARSPAQVEGIAGVTMLPLDVREDASVRDCMARVEQESGPVDALVNNAGVTLFGACEEISMEEAKALFETNFFGVVRMTHAVLPHMRARRRGSIVNIGSIAGFLPTPFETYYGAAKHAIEGYSESLSYEVGPFGISVSIVEPGFIRTSMDRNFAAARVQIDDYRAFRNTVVESTNASIRKGADPSVVGQIVLRALKARRPKLRYLAGRDALGMRMARSLVPGWIFAKGVRAEFGLRRLP